MRVFVGVYDIRFGVMHSVGYGLLEYGATECIKRSYNVENYKIYINCFFIYIYNDLTSKSAKNMKV